jgi:hypothetical protein
MLAPLEILSYPETLHGIVEFGPPGEVSSSYKAQVEQVAGEPASCMPRRREHHSADIRSTVGRLSQPTKYFIRVLEGRRAGRGATGSRGRRRRRRRRRARWAGGSCQSDGQAVVTAGLVDWTFGTLSSRPHQCAGHSELVQRRRQEENVRRVDVGG